MDLGTILKGNFWSLSYVTTRPSWLHWRQQDYTVLLKDWDMILALRIYRRGSFNCEDRCRCPEVDHVVSWVAEEA